MEREVETYVSDLISEDPSLFIVAVNLKGNEGNQRLVIALDGDNGVSIDACVSVSRRLAVMLEERDLISGKYHLEVTSVGIDQPLASERQYRKNIGRSLKVKLVDGKKIEGALTEVTEGGISLTIKEKKKEISEDISFDQIDSAKVLVSFK
ncbi:ribosome maturation factor RimP [Marinoscillum sp. MHG1-6]|uniref:ribosome maturation factor RimP n=1 Tax=Marinoscillum sp. MHG1-6 TaxID=2959627 RepID=UPI0021584E43|nr:ribosome maturation factor RimP [Marinoscillum sp. MHG1-6]